MEIPLDPKPPDRSLTDVAPRSFLIQVVTLLSVEEAVVLTRTCSTFRSVCNGAVGIVCRTRLELPTRPQGVWGTAYRSSQSVFVTVVGDEDRKPVLNTESNVARAATDGSLARAISPPRITDGILIEPVRVATLIEDEPEDVELWRLNWPLLRVLRLVERQRAALRATTAWIPPFIAAGSRESFLPSVANGSTGVRSMPSTAVASTSESVVRGSTGQRAQHARASNAGYDPMQVDGVWQRTHSRRMFVITDLGDILVKEEAVGEAAEGRRRAVRAKVMDKLRNPKKLPPLNEQRGTELPLPPGTVPVRPLPPSNANQSWLAHSDICAACQSRIDALPLRTPFTSSM